jgi:sec-independent protein translocase protein TatA
MPNIGAPELLLILALALLILGPGKLPEVGNALGKTLREFRKASSDVEEAARIEPATAAATAAKPVSAASANGAAESSAEDPTAS